MLKLEPNILQAAHFIIMEFSNNIDIGYSRNCRLIPTVLYLPQQFSNACDV